jgi:hypothetical protein
MFMIKTQMLAAGWTVVSSCGYYSGAWNYGAADHWPTADSVRWKEADNKFGWLVMKNTNLHAGGNGFQVMFALDKTATLTYYMTMKTSIEGGFSGGNETTAPDATDSVMVLNSAVDTWYTTVGVGQLQCPVALNIWYSSDGQSFRIWGAGVISTNPPTEEQRAIHPMMFERLVDAPAWMDKPVVSGILHWRKADMFTWANTAYSQRRLYFSQGSIHKCAVMMTAEAIGTTGVLVTHTASQSADPNGNWTVYPASVFSVNGMVPGYIGKFADFWAVPDALATGDYFPGDGSREMVVIQGVLQGNDGTAVSLP